MIHHEDGKRGADGNAINDGLLCPDAVVDASYVHACLTLDGLHAVTQETHKRLEDIPMHSWMTVTSGLYEPRQGEEPQVQPSRGLVDFIEAPQGPQSRIPLVKRDE